MKKIILCFALLVSFSAAAERDDLVPRIALAEAVFEERFSSERVERLLSRNLVDELLRLEKGAGVEYAMKIRKLLKDVALDVSTSNSFRDQYAGWLATQLSKSELQELLQFLRSDLGRKLADLDDRVQPLLSEALKGKSKGRLEGVPLLMAEARSK